MSGKSGLPTDKQSVYGYLVFCPLLNAVAKIAS